MRPPLPCAQAPLAFIKRCMDEHADSGIFTIYVANKHMTFLTDPATFDIFFNNVRITITMMQ